MKIYFTFRVQKYYIFLNRANFFSFFCKKQEIYPYLTLNSFGIGVSKRIVFSVAGWINSNTWA